MDVDVGSCGGWCCCPLLLVVPKTFVLVGIIFPVVFSIALVFLGLCLVVYRTVALVVAGVFTSE